MQNSEKKKLHLLRLLGVVLIIVILFYALNFILSLSDKTLNPRPCVVLAL